MMLYSTKHLAPAKIKKRKPEKETSLCLCKVSDAKHTKEEKSVLKDSAPTVLRKKIRLLSVIIIGEKRNSKSSN